MVSDFKVLEERAMDYAKCLFIDKGTPLDEVDIAMISVGVLMGISVTLEDCDKH